MPFAVFLRSSGLLASILLLTGCGGGGENLLPVEGLVTADSQPVPKGTVRFVPDTSKGNTFKHEPIGEIGSDGKYIMKTQGKVGVPAGHYKVGIVSSETPDSTKPNATKTYVGAHFGDPEKSNLKAEVKASPAAGAYDFKISAK